MHRTEGETFRGFEIPLAIFTRIVDINRTQGETFFGVFKCSLEIEMLSERAPPCEIKKRIRELHVRL